ncbi:MAG TPA: hypothetical protein PLL75_04745 [Candidatus Omnitrophota bacterium]|nr:hypothetical protein [Candidatus Omnitrophota bacterium]HPS37018.1 hypothetical protein [Candidatus Omnitrophota bacterium]
MEENEGSKEETGNLPEETKEARFKRLAEQRVAATMDKIRLIGNLASSQYSYNGDQVAKIFAALKDAIADVEDKFQRTLERKKEKFHF